MSFYLTKVGLENKVIPFYENVSESCLRLFGYYDLVQLRFWLSFTLELLLCCTQVREWHYNANLRRRVHLLNVSCVLWCIRLARSLETMQFSRTTPSPIHIIQEASHFYSYTSHVFSTAFQPLMTREQVCARPCLSLHTSSNINIGA